MNYPTEDFDPTQYIPQPRKPLFAGLAAPEGSTEAGTLPKDGTLQTGTKQPRTIWPRQPHLGYTLGLVLIGGLILIFVAVLVFGVGSGLGLLPPVAEIRRGLELPRASLLAEAITYALTSALVVHFFQRMWQRSFAEVLHLGFAAARRNAGKLVLLGVVTSIAAQVAETHMTLPKQMPIDSFFRSPGAVWIVAIFGTFIAPPAEELFFRGFLLRSVAIAFDWVRSRGSEEDRLAWVQTDTLSRPAWIFSGILTSATFAVMHAAQLGFAWNAVAVLTVVGGVLTAVRLRFNSVAASTVVHMAYNGFIFAVLFVATGGFQHLEKLMDR